MNPPLQHCTARRERQLRKQWRREYKERGEKYPKLATIGLVELDAITCPEWAWFKAVPGLTRTDKIIWLRRILARHLVREDQDAGGNPKITFTYYRPCKICKRPLIGPDAENRWNLDRRWEGWRIPCAPDCVECEQRVIESKQHGNRKGK